MYRTRDYLESARQHFIAAFVAAGEPVPEVLLDAEDHETTQPQPNVVDFEQWCLNRTYPEADPPDIA